jgi:2-phospho-L-lactate guanylyltransferase
MVQGLDVVAVIPMKELADSKRRLAEYMAADQRGDIVIGMLRRVIVAIQGATTGPVWVVGGDRRVSNLARNFEALWMEDFARNLNDTLSKAFELVFQRGQSALYVAGDLPFLKASDILSMVTASRQGNNITLAPARRDGGTNSILVPHGLPFQPQLGRRSFSRHISQAAKLGISVAICSSPGLGFDLDTGDDLEAYQHMEPGLLERLTSPLKPGREPKP